MPRAGAKSSVREPVGLGMKPASPQLCLCTFHSPRRTRLHTPLSATPKPRKLWKAEGLFFPYTGRNSFDSSTWPIGRRVLYSLIIPSKGIPTSCCRSAKMLEYGHLPGSSVHVSNILSICHILFLKFQNFFIRNHIWHHGLGQRDCVSVTQAHRVVEGDQHQFIPAKHLEQCQTAHGGLSADGSCPCC